MVKPQLNIAKDIIYYNNSHTLIKEIDSTYEKEQLTTFEI